MASFLQRLRTLVSAKRPDPARLSEGGIGIAAHNLEPGLFIKDTAGGLVKIGPAHVGMAAPNATPAAGGHAGNSAGEFWVKKTQDPAVLWYYDAGSNSWQPCDGLDGYDLKADTLYDGPLSDRNLITNPTFSSGPNRLGFPGYPGDWVADCWDADIAGVTNPFSYVNSARGISGTQSALRAQAAGALPANARVSITQQIFGAGSFNFDRPLTVAFEARSAAPAKIGVHVYQWDRTTDTRIDVISPRVFSTTTQIARFTASGVIPSEAAMLSSSATRLRIEFWFAAGSDYAAKFPELVNVPCDTELTKIQL